MRICDCWILRFASSCPLYPVSVTEVFMDKRDASAQRTNVCGVTVLKMMCVSHAIQISASLPLSRSRQDKQDHEHLVRFHNWLLPEVELGEPDLNHHHSSTTMITIGVLRTTWSQCRWTKTKVESTFVFVLSDIVIMLSVIHLPAPQSSISKERSLVLYTAQLYTLCKEGHTHAAQRIDANGSSR